ncbi:lipocalin family protein [Cellulophaga sp. L1A9]|uniref:lipocalin family protein n=1 Tax=Cellulophaga sp. L1A9 TaxID=2686362 RepID=UPI00131B4DCF|nr:lipocalin family protein [Cellulophaga sp. L1A9]
MRKIVILSVVCSVLLSSCIASKAAREKRNLISGTWELTNISFEGKPGSFKSVIFNDALDICFEGSNWFFRDNNSTGRYTIAQSTLCSGGDRYIRWSVIETDYGTSQLQFKAIDEKNKDISGGYGYRLDIDALSASNMRLKSNVMADGEQVAVVYEFTKQ